MSVCDFIIELNRLRKSSSESIDSTNKFDEFKEYIHVERTAERDLKAILKKVNATGKKTLFMLCGSAGDGKSHLMSYLKNSEPEKLIENYQVYNDATEVSSQCKKPNETLNELLDRFSDEKCDESGQNLILAINLGVLSNFVESEYAKTRFNRLKTYVEKCNILTSMVNDNDYDASSPFQHISFADYNLFSLGEEGVVSDYIERLLDKIFAENETNIFFKAYKKKSVECPLTSTCPIKNNFEMFMDKNNRKYISQLLVKGIVKDKEIITTREIFNYVYDVLVSPEFSFDKMCMVLSNPLTMLKEYVKNITPTLMFDNADVTPLMNQLQKYDPVLKRTEEADAFAVHYNVSAEIEDQIRTYLKGSSYESVLANNKLIGQINSDKVLKLHLFKSLIRINEIMNYNENDEVYISFLKDLYYYNAGHSMGLASLYNKVQKAVIQWCGSESDANVCLDDSIMGYSVYEDLDFKEYLDNMPKKVDDGQLQRFTPNIVIEFTNKHTSEIVRLTIDYSLYELISKLNEGYIQTADDRNNHADFIIFVEKMLYAGSLGENILIVSDRGEKAVVKKTGFGYEFKVVK